MKTNKMVAHVKVLATVVGASLALTSLAGDVKPVAAPAPLTAERDILVTLSATVEAVDLAKREVTLKGQAGNVVTLEVDERVQRLNEFKVGDAVVADYYASVACELRAATAEEKENPVAIVEGAGRASKEVAPGAMGVRAIKVVTTVVSLDLLTQTVSLQGPLGKIGDLYADKVENLKQLRLGDTVVVTYTEAVAVSLQKAKPAKKE